MTFIDDFSCFTWIYFLSKKLMLSLNSAYSALTSPYLPTRSSAYAQTMEANTSHMTSTIIVCSREYLDNSQYPTSFNMIEYLSAKSAYSLTSHVACSWTRICHITCGANWFVRHMASSIFAPPNALQIRLHLNYFMGRNLLSPIYVYLTSKLLSNTLSQTKGNSALISKKAFYSATIPKKKVGASIFLDLDESSSPEISRLSNMRPSLLAMTFIWSLISLLAPTSPRHSQRHHLRRIIYQTFLQQTHWSCHSS